MISLLHQKGLKCSSTAHQHIELTQNDEILLAGAVSQSRQARLNHLEVPDTNMQTPGKPNDMSILVAIGTYQRACNEPEG